MIQLSDNLIIRKKNYRAVTDHRINLSSYTHRWIASAITSQ